MDSGQEPQADFLDLVGSLLEAAALRDRGDVALCLDKLHPGYALPAESTDQSRA